MGVHLRVRGHPITEQQHRQHPEDEYKQDLLDKHVQESDDHASYLR